MQLRTISKDGHLKAGHEAPFRPTIDPKEKVHRAPYIHMSDRVEVKRNFRDIDGHVIVQPRQIITNPPKKGTVGKQVYLGEKFGHMPDEYDNSKLEATKAFKAAKAKEQEKPFSQKVRSMPYFATIKQAFGEDVQLAPKKSPSPSKPAVTHDMPFRPPINPPKSGYNCTLSKHPEYKPCPPKVV